MKKLIPAVAALAALIIAAILIIPSCTQPSPAPLNIEDYLHKQWNQIMHILGQGGSGFSEEFTWEKQTDEEGTSYYVGVLSDDLDAMLDEMVDRYNVDPTTEKPVTIEKIQFCLTSGIAEATDGIRAEDPLMRFIHWAAAPADLVYKEGTVLPDGSTVTELRAFDLDEKPPSNYEYLLRRGGTYFDFEYRSNQELQ